MITWNGPIMGHLNSFSASGGGNLNKNFPNIQMPGGLPGGIFMLRFDWCIISTPKNLGPQSSGPQSINCKTIVTHNNFRHCRVHFYGFLRQPFGACSSSRKNRCDWLIGVMLIYFNFSLSLFLIDLYKEKNIIKIINYTKT